MKRDFFNWGEGVVEFWDMDKIDASASIKSQVDELKEDLVQVQYPKNITLDVGWCPEFDVNGMFIVTIIQDENWGEPLVVKECNNFKDFCLIIEECIKITEQIVASSIEPVILIEPLKTKVVQTPQAEEIAANSNKKVPAKNKEPELI